jgi:cell division protein ZapE
MDAAAAAKGPLFEYRRRLGRGEIGPDPAQALAIEKLQSLYQALRNYQPSTGVDGWKERFGLGRRREEPPQGLYLFGAVGRGKTMVMDIFFQSADIERKRRIHFHAFMNQVHGRIEDMRDKGASGNPIPPLAKALAEESWLICFDELQVLDIADAMILGHLFEEMFKCGAVVVTTSNRPPRDLYKDGLQRERFLPFIGLLERRMDIMQLDGNNDHRLATIRAEDSYIVPHNPQAVRKLSEMFERFTSGAAVKSHEVRVRRRRVEIPIAADGVAFTTFEDLCEKPYGPRDYLEIAARYHTVIMSGIPVLGPEKRNEAKRFVTLIDTLYDRGVTFICSAAAAPKKLYEKGKGAFEFKRTASRLIEMQSEEYMASRHQAAEWSGKRE